MRHPSPKTSFYWMCISEDLSMANCPSCSVELPEDAILCVSCGYHLSQRRHLAAAVGDSQSETREVSRDVNPYLSPQDDSSGTRKQGAYLTNYDMKTRVEFLEERVRELERRIDSTRLVAPDFFARMFAVCGHAVLGYFIVLTLIFLLLSVVRALT